MTALRIVMALLCGLVCSGCFQTAAVLKINADGSGTVVTRRIFLTSTRDRLRHLLATFGADAPDQGDFDPTSTESISRTARAFGVTMVSSTPIHEPEGDGLTATFSFSDINTLPLVELIARLSEPDDAAYIETTTRPLTIELRRNPDGSAALRVRLSFDFDFDSAPAFARNTNQALERSAETALIRDLMRGSRLVLAVEPNGSILRANTPYVDDGSVTLLDIEPERMMTDEFEMKLAGARTEEEKRAVLADAAGAKIAIAPEVTIEFMPN